MKVTLPILVMCLILSGCGSCQREEGPAGGKAAAPAQASPQPAAAAGAGKIQVAPLQPTLQAPPEGGAPAAAKPEKGAGMPAQQPQAGAAGTTVPPEDQGDCVVVADVNNDFGPPPLTVAFTAEAECEHGKPTFKWTFGDGSPPSTEANPSHTYTQLGDYVATVTVTGEDGAISTDEIDIFVEED